MSEYWVSHKKYFCKYCNIYIADDVPSRRQHESGLRHKGNVERFVRGLYKEGEKRKQDLEEEKREMARVEQVRGLDTHTYFLLTAQALRRPHKLHLHGTWVLDWSNRAAVATRQLPRARPRRPNLQRNLAIHTPTILLQNRLATRTLTRRGCRLRPSGGGCKASPATGRS